MADEIQSLLDEATTKAKDLGDLTEQAALEDAAEEARRELEALAGDEASDASQKTEETAPVNAWENELQGLLDEADTLTQELFNKEEADEKYQEVMMPTEKASDDLFDMPEELKTRSDATEEAVGEASEDFDVAAFESPDEIIEHQEAETKAEPEASSVGGLEVVGTGSGLLNVSRDAVTDVYQDDFAAPETLEEDAEAEAAADFDAAAFESPQTVAEKNEDEKSKQEESKQEEPKQEEPKIAEDADIQTIDDILAQGAEDALEGEFESVEDVIADTSDAAVEMGGETYTRLPADISQDDFEAPPIVEKGEKPDAVSRGKKITVDESAPVEKKVAPVETATQPDSLAQEAVALNTRPDATQVAQVETLPVQEVKKVKAADKVADAKAKVEKAMELASGISGKMAPLKPVAKQTLKLVCASCGLMNKPLDKFPEIKKYVGYAAMVTFINALLMFFASIIF